MGPPRIAIIGGGPGGLTLARLLHLQNIPSTVYELDEHRSAREQGGSLDLHHGTGLTAIKAMDLMPQFRAHARPEGEHIFVYSTDGEVLLDHGASEPAPEGEENLMERPEIDRTDLRGIMLDSLPDGCVVWNRKVASISLSPAAEPGVHTITFSDNTTAEADLVIGADGCWSKVRQFMLPDIKPAYTGITYVDLRIHDVHTRFPEIAAMVGEGLMFALGHGKGLLGQMNGKSVLRTYVTFPLPPTWSTDTTSGFPSLLSQSPAAVRSFLLSQFPSWSPKLLSLISQSDDSPILVRPIYALPKGLRWETHPGVTLLGDAAHVMAPSGEGVNLAMLDAVELAEQLVPVLKGEGWRENLVEAVRKYEGPMLDRAAKEAEDAEGMQEMFFGADAPKKFLDFMDMVTSQQGPPGGEGEAPDVAA
ncbi:hypothetical protein HDV00_001373 [Rhizophlyctis rosea]|nr:hypothetical protein HDV00_001373 [Rhizophlyctis rosea]